MSDTNVPGLIKKLKTSEWMSPKFQRDFVWSNAAVVSLVNSIIDARPVGMITLWEQEEGSGLDLEPVSIPDWDNSSGRTGLRFFTDNSPKPGRCYAILDGRQRSTALALAFGGLRAHSGLYRHAGRYFLDVCAQDEAERVVFVSEKDVNRRGLHTLKIAISHGLFPLEVNDPDAIFDQWMSYLQHLRDPGFYEDGELPPSDELDRRNKTLQAAFNGIIKTKIAIYTVPRGYNLAEICDIFETLNTTGTKVSTVDLIHSNLYNDTVNDKQPLLMRDRIDDIGEMDGAVGWASSKDRPELIAQMATAAYVAVSNKPDPRPTGGKREYKISSIKSQDLLALPSDFWRDFFARSEEFANYVGAFQQAVAGGSFGLSHCPYPASAAIYIGLRWSLAEISEPKSWTREHLDALFRAFFWRNALATRYDQGFLSQVGTDIKVMKDFLGTVSPGETFDDWRVRASAWLTSELGPSPEFDAIYDIVSDGSEAGALRRSGLLLLFARASTDIYDGSNISFGSQNLQLHHIYPKDWCANNAAGPLLEYLDSDVAKKDWINSPANLMPMGRHTNNLWRKRLPQQFLAEMDVDFDSRTDLWNRYFISNDAYAALARGAEGLPEFWNLRARAITSEIVRRTVV